MHSCFVAMNEHLAPKNTRLSFAMQVPSGVELLVVSTEHIRKLRNGQKPIRAMASFCPFCGKGINEKGFNGPCS